jgi:hypothetical protein
MSKRSLTTTFLLCCALALTGGGAQAGPAGKVAVITASPAAVTPGSTYAWAPFNTALDPRVANDIMQARMRAAVDASLAAKGFVRVDHPAMADLVVSYRMGVQDQVQARTTPAYPQTFCGFRGCVTAYTRYGAPAVEIDRFMEGTLVVDLVDTDSGRLVWRAASKKRVTQKDASQARLNAVVADMTRTLPGA